MKLGEIYTEGGWKHEVIGFDGNGYPIGKKITSADVKEIQKPIEKVQEVIDEPKDEKITKTDVNRMSVAKLTSFCKELGIEPSTGSEMKKEIIAKLGL